MRWLLYLCLFLPLQLLAREVPITILHTCDLHGNVLPTENYDGRTNLGGIARCATSIRQIREQEKNVLLVDAGDTIQGAAVSYLSDGQVMVKALNELRYDAWCWGNHEFDWGLPKLLACAERAQMPILNANLRRGEAELEKSDPAAQILARLKPYRLVEVDGIKVGIIGLNTPGIPSWSRPRLIRGLQFADSVETLKTVVPAVRAAGARVLVLVCHQGYRDGGDDHANQVNAIGRNFPELDVIIGGHTHRNFPEFKVGNVLYCQANYYGIHLGRVDLVYDTEAARVTQRRSQTLEMNEKVPLDGGVLKVCGAELDRAAKYMGTVIGEATADFDTSGAPKRETPVHNLLCEAIVAALRAHDVKVEAVVHGLFDKKATFRKGPITMTDVWRVVPYENTLGVLHLNPAQLKDILEENAGAYDRYDFRGVWGLQWTFDPNGTASNRVGSIRHANGSPLKPDEQIAVAFNSYELASGGLRWKKVREYADLPAAKLVECDVQTRQAVVDYIRDRGSVCPVTKGWWKVQRSGSATDN